MADARDVDLVEATTADVRGVAIVLRADVDERPMLQLIGDCSEFEALGLVQAMQTRLAAAVADLVDLPPELEIEEDDDEED